MVTMWDYKTLKFETEVGILNGTQFDESFLEVALKSWGQDGWELVSIFDVSKLSIEFILLVLFCGRYTFVA